MYTLKNIHTFFADLFEFRVSNSDQSEERLALFEQLIQTGCEQIRGGRF